MPKSNFRNLVAETFDNLDDLRIYLDVILNDLEREAGQPSPAILEPTTLDHVKEAHRTLDKVNNEVQALSDALYRLLAQRKTTHEAFEAGYYGRYLDMLSKLGGEECAHLRHLLSQDENYNTWSKEDIPF